MPRANPLQPSFNGGEFSPRMAARTDFAKYPLACATLQNMVPLPQGGATRRPGTCFVAEIKDSSKTAKLRRFEFSTEQAYILECGAFYFRFYKDRGRIEVASTDAAIANGTFDGGISGWTDQSNGTGAIAHDAAVEALALQANGAGNEAIAEQAVTTTATGQEHVLFFRVLGAAGDQVTLRIGASSGAEDILPAAKFAVGWHARSFTPATSPFFLQFENGLAKSLSVDDIAMVERIYALAGQPFTADTRAAMEAFMDDHPRGKWGNVEYRLEDLGFDLAERRAALAFYSERFALRDER